MEINKITSRVDIYGYTYKRSNKNNICINKIIFCFNDGTNMILYAKTDILELFTVFADIDKKHDKNSSLFDINKILRETKIVKIIFEDIPTFKDRLNGYDIYYNKISIYYSNLKLIDKILCFEFYILQSSNGFYSGYFIIE